MATLDTAKNYSPTLVGIATQFGLTTALSCASFVAFEFHRRWSLTQHLYSTRCRLERNASPPPPKTPFVWVGTVLSLKESFFLTHVGLDCVIYLRFLKMAFQLLLFSTLTIAAILMPLNFFAQEAVLIDVEKVSIGNIPNGSNMLWIHWLLIYFFSLSVLYLLHRNTKDYVKLRMKYIQKKALKGSIQTRTVMVTHVPDTLKHEERLRTYFGNLGLGSVESVTLIRLTTKISRKLKRREAILRDLELAHIQLLRKLLSATKKHGIKALHPDITEDGLPEEILKAWQILASYTQGNHGADVSPHLPVNNQMPIWETLNKIDRQLLDKYQPIHKTGIFRTGVNVVTIDYLLEKFNRLDRRIAELRQVAENAHYYKPMGTAFITFKNQSAAQLCAQSITSSKPHQCITKLAPEPRDILWENHIRSNKQKFIRKIIVNASIWALTILWLSLSTYFLSLASYEKLSERVPYLANLANSTPWVKSLIQTVLPSILTSTFMVAMPNIFLGVSYQQCYSSYSELEISTINRYYRFIIFNVLFVFLLGPAFIDVIIEVIQSPTHITNVLAANLPKGAAFFINYVILQTSSHGLEILQIGVPLFYTYLFGNRFVVKTPRDLQNSQKPYPFPYYYYLPTHILILVICITYSIINPLILVFGVIYYGIAIVVYRYQFAYTYIKQYETNGQYWRYMFRYVSDGLIIFQLAMIGLLALKNAVTASLALLPLLGGTFYFKIYHRQTFRGLMKYCPLDSLKDQPNSLSLGDQSKSALHNPSQSECTENSQLWSKSTIYRENPEIILPEIQTNSPRETRLNEEVVPSITDSPSLIVTSPTLKAHSDAEIQKTPQTSATPSPTLGPLRRAQPISSHSYLGIEGGKNSTDLQRPSPSKHRFQKLQNQIFSNPLLTLFFNPFANTANILPDSDQVAPNPIHPSREVYQDETSMFDTYIHPDFIRALPGRIWLPINPKTKRFDLDEGVLEHEECLTSSLFPVNESSLICYRGRYSKNASKSEAEETAKTVQTNVTYDKANQHLVYVSDPSTSESESGSTYRRRGTIRGTGSSIMDLIGGAFRGLGGVENEASHPELSPQIPTHSTRRSSVSSGLST